MSRSKSDAILHGGYSDVRLWPCYLVFSGIGLGLSPLVGGFIAFTLGILLAAISGLCISASASSTQRATSTTRINPNRKTPVLHSVH